MYGKSIKKMCILILSACFLCVFQARGFASEARAEYDVVVIGGGFGGCAAAIQAAREGFRAAVVERSDWVGGQATGAAVSTMDDLGLTRSGIYGEFISRVRERYARLGTATNICLWGADTIAFEPRAGCEILLEMLRETGRVDLFLRTKVERADVRGGRVRSVFVQSEPKGAARELRAAVFIDATEHGDFIPLTGAAYRVGNSVSPNVDLEANVQDITYVAVIRKYPEGLPEELRMPGPPPDYERYAGKFRSVVTRSGDTWPGSYPFGIPTHNAYRALPDPENNALIVGDESETWGLITKTCVNWANDYPGNKGDKPGLSVRYIEDHALRGEIERDAMLRTLAFLWYAQSELGMSDWSVDDSQGYGEYFSNNWKTAGDSRLPREFAPILRHFPPFPYVREGRRIVGVKTLKQADITRDPLRMRAKKNFPTSIALGEYPVDVHGSHLDRYMEHDLGESSESFPRTWAGKQGVFQVPLETLIPAEIDGLIAAEKNISVSRMVGGAIRLHPIVMHTGQAAGAIAAEACRTKMPPRYVDPVRVQNALMDAGQYLALDRFWDAASGDVHWKGVQWASLSESLEKISNNSFGANLPITRAQLSRVLHTAYPGRKINLPPAGSAWITRAEFLEALRTAGVPMPENPALFFAHPDMNGALERGEAAALVFESLTAGKDPKGQ